VKKPIDAWKKAKGIVEKSIDCGQKPIESLKSQFNRWKANSIVEKPIQSLKKPSDAVKNEK